MQNGRAHPLLAQLPLTVSPFIDLPKAATLPYTYKTLQTSLGPSSVGESSDTEKAKYVVSASGHAAHPQEIIASCQSLQSHMQKQKTEAKTALENWQSTISARELAEKRRIAPGWLDSNDKILQPKRQSGTPAPSNVLDQSIMDSQEAGPVSKGLVEQREDEGNELDRAFGGMSVR